MMLFAELESALRETMLFDRNRLRRKLREIREAQRSGKPFDRNLERWRAACAESRRLLQERQANRPLVYYDETLPIHEHRAAIAQALMAHQVVVVAGETGSGKSTQLPKICLELGRGVAGMIGHTQPRRIAARTLATRIADELGVVLGREVGYQVRFTDVTSPHTYIKLMTDGLLLAETQGDRWLLRYDTLIIDEAHERSLNIDFLLGYLHRVLARRHDLKVIITSATIDAERFAAHFAPVVGNVPILQVSGRSYPVEIVYHPWDVADRDEEPDWLQAVVEGVSEACARGPGDVLVFLPTERDIHEAMKRLRGQSFAGGRYELLPLYARLALVDQQRVFQPAGARKIVLSTNVAESSLTVPGIRYVVDTGLARLSRYSPRSKMQRLPIEPVSQASADQRAGRCGREGPGVCFRLFSEEDYQRRERYTPPEILRANLADVILRLEALGLGTVEQFAFLDPPRAEAIRDGYKTLFELGAVDRDHRLTPLGQTLHRYPVDPRIARLIVAGDQEGCLAEILIIAAALEVQDPRERPLDKQQLADEAHATFADPESDFLSFLRLWRQFQTWRAKLTRTQLRKVCQQHFLSYLRMQEWLDIHRELLEVVQQERRGASVRGRRGSSPRPDLLRVDPADLPEGSWPAHRYAAIHRALLTAFLSNVALRTEQGDYLLAGSVRAVLWPGSSLAAQPPRWLVAAELVETSRRYLRTVARIDPSWIEPLAGHLVQRTYSAPYWDAHHLAAMAEEKVALFGLPIVPRRRVRYGRVDPQAARQLLLRQGLVGGEWPDPPEFLAHNLELARGLAERQARLRQPAAFRDEEALCEFYATRIPAEIVEGQQLVQWWRREQGRHPQMFHMTEADLLVPETPSVDTSLFPDRLQSHGLDLPLHYKHEPGSPDDGVTLRVPQICLSRLPADRLAWLVPGMLEEKVTALLRTLPKEIRRDLAPLAQMAHEVAQHLSFGEGLLIPAIAKVLERLRGIAVPAHAFREDKIPDHLRMRIEVLDESGAVLAAGRDLNALLWQCGTKVSATFCAAVDARWQQDGLTAWTFGELPETTTVERAGFPLVSYPALVDCQESVAIRLFDSAVQANHVTRYGLRRLFCLASARELKRQTDHLPYLNTWTLLSPTFPQPFPLREHLQELIAERAFLVETPWPRSAESFAERLAAGQAQLSHAAAEVTRTVQALFEAYTLVRRAWEKTAHPLFRPTRNDVHDQLQHLLAPGFLITTPWERLVHLPRYLRAMARRLEKLPGGGHHRDVQLLDNLLPRWQRYKERRHALAARGLFAPHLETYRWMMEEYRVWLFAQELGTAISISEKRLDRQWGQVETA